MLVSCACHPQFNRFELFILNYHRQVIAAILGLLVLFVGYITLLGS